MKMRTVAVRWLGLIGAMAGLGLMAACEWEGGSGVDSWSEDYNQINVNGTYRGYNGGPLVSDYSTIPGSATSERIGTGNGTATAYSGALRYRNVVPGSLMISTSAGWAFTDDGNGKLQGDGISAHGTIAYASGGWSLNFEGLPPGNVPFHATYRYEQSGAGSSGNTLYTFTVFQQGNLLRITDNNGGVYEGHLGRLAEDRVNFTATGTSRAGVKVEISGVFNAPFIMGTWVESGGRTGDILGVTQGGASTTITSTNAP